MAHLMTRNFHFKIALNGNQNFATVLKRDSDREPSNNEKKKKKCMK